MNQSQRRKLFRMYKKLSECVLLWQLDSAQSPSDDIQYSSAHHERLAEFKTVLKAEHE